MMVGKTVVLSTMGIVGVHVRFCWGYIHIYIYIHKVYISYNSVGCPRKIEEGYHPPSNH